MAEHSLLAIAPDGQSRPFDQLWQRVFLVAYRNTLNFSYAAECAGVSRRYAENCLSSDPKFAAEVEDAYAAGIDALEEECRRRALARSDRLLMFILRGARPDRYDPRYLEEKQLAEFRREALRKAEETGLDPDRILEAARHIMSAMAGA